MSDTNGFAKKEYLEQRRGRRRFKPYRWADVGRLELQSTMAAEWIRIEAARQRVQVAALSGKKKEHEAASQELMLLTLYIVPLDSEHNPFFTPADKDLILSLDGALTDSLLNACLEHCATDESALRDSQKNLPPTSGDNSPSDFGTT